MQSLGSSLPLPTIAEVKCGPCDHQLAAVAIVALVGLALMNLWRSR